HIRITSFIETVRKRRSSRLPGSPVVPLPDPYSVKFTSEHRRTHTVLVPNVTESFAHIASAAMRREGYKVAPLPLADERARYLGKKYVHNDMCFPAQINIGEFLAAMENGGWDPDKVALGLAKDHCDCRLAHYATVARRALDEAGYPQVPIITTGKDTKDQHPDFNLSPLFQIRMLWGLAALDVLENLRRRIRPYETDPGSTDRIYWECVDALSSAMDISLKSYIREFTRCIDRFSRIEFDSRARRPRIFIIGEFLLNFHPGSNNRIERYLEEHGMEVIMPNVIYNFHREYLRFESERRDFGVQYPWMEALIQNMSEKVFRSVIARVQNMAGECPIYEAPRDFRELAASAEHIIHRTFTSGEGWMIAAEILEHARHGVDSFLILQPFGCLPNHVTGRGLVKRIKQDRPGIQILSLDYDPDTSFANIENRLQMLILTAKERAAKKTSAAAKATDASSMRV
ncbi:MAG: activase, partial [Spirochaeta sp.]